MRLRPTRIMEAFLVIPERREDERGFFARTWCQREFEPWGIPTSFVQCSISFSLRKGTLRGMHFQTTPHEEIKLVRCTAGSIVDVIVDVRPHSATFRRWYMVELSATNLRQLLIPKGVAHGFQTLTDRTELIYQMSEFYSPGAERGFRYDDPSLRIPWPLKVVSISTKDISLPLFDEMDIFAPAAVHA